MRAFLAAFGDAGHVFPVLALGRALRARGHEVTVETFTRWRNEVEAEGLRFVAAPEFEGDADRSTRFLPPFVAAGRAVPLTRAELQTWQPDVVVSDILTVAPPLAAELERIPAATLIPHFDPRPVRGFPPYSIGARLPRTAIGRWWWARFDRLVRHGGALGRDELNGVRARVGLPPQDHIHNGISTTLAICATFPQLEYPRPRPESNTHVVGPLLWEPADGEFTLPAGDGPLVVVAPSTAHDPDGRLVRAAADGLAELPIRLLISTNHRLPSAGLDVAANTTVVDWLSYSRAFAHADAVICHGGHGTMVRALACGAVPVIWPVAGDMGENAARADHAGAGVRIPRRFLSARTLRLATERALCERPLRARAAQLAAWAAGRDPAATAAELVESIAA